MAIHIYMILYYRGQNEELMTVIKTWSNTWEAGASDDEIRERTLEYRPPVICWAKTPTSVCLLCQPSKTRNDLQKTMTLRQGRISSFIDTTTKGNINVSLQFMFSTYNTLFFNISFIYLFIYDLTCLTNKNKYEIRRKKFNPFCKSSSL